MYANMYASTQPLPKMTAPAASQPENPVNRGSTYYGEGEVGRGGMLNMLAEVASQTLTKETNLDALNTKTTKPKESKRKGQNVTFNLSQLLNLSNTQLVKLFSVFSSDELKRQYSYSCALVPTCGQNYTSFASENKARTSIRSHLLDHLDFLKQNAETYASFTATAVKYTKPRSTVQNKKAKIQQAKKQPNKETLNKENKDAKVGKSTNYLRKILSNDVNVKDYENSSGQEKFNDLRDTNFIETKKDTSDVKVLGDHSYFEHVKEDNANLENSFIVNGMSPNDEIKKNIMLTTGENADVSMKDSLHTKEQAEAIKNEVNDMTLNRAETSNASDAYVPAKPKGKAKFIGTSEAERQMALELINKIRLTGNPSGNNLQCCICNPPRTFTAPTTLVSHYRSHAGIKPYSCRICTAVFTRRHSLKYHMLIHQNLTRFTCGDCDKKFRHPSHFREHLRRHTGESPFECGDCKQRFKTRNTYKRHLKTRHGKVLMISGELLNLSEEDSKKVKTKNRRKKQEVSPVIINETSVTTESTVDPSGQQLSWPEQEISNSVNENGAQQSIDNSMWIYQNQSDLTIQESYNEIQTKSPINKTEFNETEIENNEVVIAQTDSNGSLHFENYNYAQDSLFAENNAVQFSCKKNVGTNIVGDKYENQEATIVEFDDYNGTYDEGINQIYKEPEEKVIVIKSEEMPIVQEEGNLEFKEVPSISNSTQTDDVIDINSDDHTVKIIPCQVKVCDNNGTATLQLLKNSKIALFGGKGQSINLIQNGKQHTILLLASGDSNLLDLDSSVIDGSKPLPVITVPAE